MTRAVIASALLLLPGAAFAQSAGYDNTTETSVAGVVRYVLSPVGADGVVGVHLDVSTASGTVRIALAPALFIANNNYYFFTDEQVYVVGATSKSGEIWARTISKDGKTFLTLRDEDGTPRWPRATDDDPDGCGVSHGPIR